MTATIGVKILFAPSGLCITGAHISFPNRQKYPHLKGPSGGNSAVASMFVGSGTEPDNMSGRFLTFALVADAFVGALPPFSTPPCTTELSRRCGDRHLCRSVTQPEASKGEGAGRNGPRDLEISTVGYLCSLVWCPCPMIFAVDSSEGERAYTENYIAKLAKRRLSIAGVAPDRKRRVKWRLALTSLYSNL
jgi:hypothetical protein